MKKRKVHASLFDTQDSQSSDLFPKTNLLLQQMRLEFPGFSILKKKENTLQKLIHYALWMLTFGQMNTYLYGYHTVLFGRLWVADSWDTMPDLERYILLRHERVHLRQRVRMGDVKMIFFYLFWFFPMGLSLGRARLEWEAYEETLRAMAEERGIDSLELFRPWLIKRFTGPDYGWMWPFPKTISAWFDASVAKMMRELETKT